VESFGGAVLKCEMVVYEKSAPSDDARTNSVRCQRFQDGWESVSSHHPLVEGEEVPLNQHLIY
jgi:hypothetical protein